jgi:hypothetical protein
MQIVKQGGRTDYNYMEIFLDTLDELDEVIKKYPQITAGSVAYIIATGAVYILNSQKEWIAQ